MRSFVLYENVVIYAYKGEDEEGNPDRTCNDLVLGIVHNGHALVFNHRFWGLYASQINRARLERAALFPGLLRALGWLILDPARVRHVPDEELAEIEGLDALPNPDENDRLFVRAAAAVPGSILATTDAPLLGDVRGSGIDRKYGFEILHPRDAATLATIASDL